MDVGITSAQIPIKYSAYAGSATTTKGTPINTNTAFSASGRSFEVSAYADADTFGKYFGFSTITSDGLKWNNTDATYWPNVDATLYLGAYTPATARLTNGGYEYDKTTSAHSLTFDYVVNGNQYSSGSIAASNVNQHEDLMYAVTSQAYTAPTKEESDADASADAEKVNLHFKHALTQVAFTATKDAEIEVTVNSITICNVMSSGSFAATKATDDDDTADGTTDGTVSDGFVNMGNVGVWSGHGDITHYEAQMFGAAAVNVKSYSTALTQPSNALMLIPQALTAWTYADTDGDTGLDDELAVLTSDNSYLAINCTIKHTGGDVNIVDGIVFVPFSTAGIVYEGGTAEDVWKPGYKVTYNLHFGGGYTDPTPGTTPEIPEPGETPDPDDLVPTLRAITYTVSVDAWETADTGAPEIDLN